MKNYLKFPLPTTASWFRLPERVKALEDIPAPIPFSPLDYDLEDFTNTATDPFVKESEVPTIPYKEYVAILSQSGTNAPTATIIRNTLGTVTFSRSSAGYYGINSSNLFTSNKTYVSVPTSKVNTGNISINVININDPSLITLETYNISGVRTEGTMIPNQIPIEIRVYN